MSEVFDGKVMAETKFTNVSLENAVFDDVNLRGARFTNINLGGAVFRDISLKDAKIDDSSIEGLTIEGQDIEALLAAEEARQPGAARIKHISPILGVADMAEALDFYTRVLLFQVVMESADYSIVQSGSGSLHLRLAEGDVPAREIYVEVTGIEALWEHVSGFKDAYKIRELFMQDYGMKEFHIIAPNNCLIFVGERV